MKKFLSILLSVVLIILLSTATVGATPLPKHNRIATGVGKTSSFEKGATVYGSIIKIDGQAEPYLNGYLVNVSTSGTVTSGVVWPWASEIAHATKLKERKVPSIPVWKVEREGKFYPEKKGYKEYLGEYIDGKYTGNYFYTGRYVDKKGQPVYTPPVTPSVPTSIDSTKTRIATGTDKTCSFEKGATVYGSIIKIDGQTEPYLNGYIVNVSAAGTVTSGVVWPWESEIIHATKLYERKTP